MDVDKLAELRRLLGAKVVFYRKLKRWNQLKLADRLGITRQYLSKIEHGQCSCSVELLVCISKVLGVDIAELINSKGLRED